GETVIDQDAIADVFLAPSLPSAKASTAAAAGTSDRTLRVVYRDGSRFTGIPTRIEDTHLTLTCPGVKEPMRLPLAELRSLSMLRNGKAPAAPSIAGKLG